MNITSAGAGAPVRLADAVRVDLLDGGGSLRQLGARPAVAQEKPATKAGEASPKADAAGPSRVLSPEQAAKKAAEDLAKQEKPKAESPAAAARKRSRSKSWTC